VWRAPRHSDAASSFLLEGCNDYHRGVVSKCDFVHILKLVESYVFQPADLAVKAWPAPTLTTQQFAADT